MANFFSSSKATICTVNPTGKILKLKSANPDAENITYIIQESSELSFELTSSL